LVLLGTTTSGGNVATSAVSERKTAKAMLLGAIIVGLGSALAFRIYPDLDLSVAKRLYISDGHFIGYSSSPFSAARLAFNILFFGACALAVIGCVITGSIIHSWITVPFDKWLYLVVCILVGPLTVANLGFKDHWGRARPQSVVEFGGDKSFSPPLIESQQCQKNCSFVSGEASSIYVVCFAAAFLFPSLAGLWILSGIVLGSAAGFVRMAEGGHFLSDVIFAGVLMALTAAIVQILFSVLRSGRSSD
jgi:lipid A 4'-phosphatase